MIKNYRKIEAAELKAVLLDAEQENSKSLGIPYAIADAGLNLPGEIVRTKSTRLALDQVPKVFDVHLVSKNGSNWHSKYLQYSPQILSNQEIEDKKTAQADYVLSRELTCINDKQEGPQYVYDKTGALERLAFFEKNKKICDLSKELRSIQVQDICKAAFGIKRRDVQTLNSDQLNVLKQRHPELTW